jgi:hypothetical protein
VRSFALCDLHPNKVGASCFAHIINIAVQHVLLVLKIAPHGDIMAQVHTLVNPIQSSRDCRVAFMDIICKGNATGDFNPKVPEVELLWEVET